MLRSRWDDVVAKGDTPRIVRRRFDLLTEVLGLDRARATRWTSGRLLQNVYGEDGRYPPTVRNVRRLADAQASRNQSAARASRRPPSAGSRS